MLESQETLSNIKVAAYPTLQNSVDKTKIIKDNEKKANPFKKAMSFSDFARTQQDGK